MRGAAGGRAPPPTARGNATPKSPSTLRAFHEEAALGDAYDGGLIRRLWPFVAPHRRLLTMALASIVLVSAAALARPLLMRFAIDEGVLAGDPSRLFKGGLALAAVVLVEQAFSFFQVYATQIVGARSMAELRRHLFQLIHRLPLAYFDKQPVGRLVTRVTNDVDAILELFSSGALNAVGDLLKLAGIVVLMIALDARLSLIAFAALPPIGLLVVLVRRKAREVFREIRGKTARINATLGEQISGVEVVQSYRREEQSQREFDEINAAYRTANLRSIKYEAMQDAAIDAVAALCLAFVVVAVGYEPVSFGTIVAFNAYLLQFFEPISALGQRYTLLQSALSGAERVATLMDVRDKDAPAHRTHAPDVPSREAFQFEHVDFAYKRGTPVLRDVSFSVQTGERIAVVGPTGSGKTTVASLLMRLYEVETGTIRICGKDIRTLERRELREQFGVVPQDLYLFSGTIASNVAADPNPDMERVEAVLTRLGVIDWILARDGGLDARVLEQGANFSVGERQLIAFARAMYRDAPIVILDEATASVDRDTEARIQRAMDELLRDRTALIIAHRLSTIRAANRILVFHKGRLVEEGSHADLMREGTLYAKLNQLQFAGPDQRTEPELSGFSSGAPASSRTSK